MGCAGRHNPFFVARVARGRVLPALREGWRCEGEGVARRASSKLSRSVERSETYGN